MSIICRMAIGYFDPSQISKYELVRCIVFDRLLDCEKVGQLQAAYDELFAIQFRLADNLAELSVCCVGVCRRTVLYSHRHGPNPSPAGHCFRPH